MRRRTGIRPLAVWLALNVVAPASGGAAQTPSIGARTSEVLVDRTLAIVGGAVVTQSDVSLAVTLGLLEQSAAGAPDAALGALVDRWLMLHEVARFAPAEPVPAAVDARVAAIRLRVGTADDLARTLAAAGRAADHLATWVRDDLRIAAYLDQRFASAGTPADADVTAWLQVNGAALDAAGVTGDAAVVAARTSLVEARRRALIVDWLADLRRRTPVVLFPPRP